MNLNHFLFFSVLLCTVNSARILGVLNMPFFSHHQLGDRLLKELAVRGHEVTVITPFEDKTPVKNFKQVILTGALEEKMASNIKFFEQADNTFVESALWLEALGHKWIEWALKHPNVQNLLKSDKKFDLVIVHQFVNFAIKGFCHHYNAVCVVLATMSAPMWTHAQTGNPDSPAYIFDLLTNPAFDVSFSQRFLNTLNYVSMRLFYHFYAMPRQNELLQKYFPKTPRLDEVLYNTSLVLINSHVSFDPPVPYLPNMIEIGGFHIKPPKKLPQDLQEYLDGAKDGVVLFSLGSNLQSKDMSEEKCESVLKAFAKLKQKVLWKWEDESIPNQPPNVKISKWLPQADIMAHPNVKLLITHGGLLSTTEAIYHGVPIIGIPIFSDQGRNVALAERSGYALSLPYKELTEKRLSHAMNELLNNPKYRENVKSKSNITHDEPLKLLDKAVFWTEYVLRHKGAPHLRSAALDLYWYQYLLLDVVAVVALIIFVPLFVLFKIVKKCCSRDAEQKLSKEKKEN